MDELRLAIRRLMKRPGATLASIFTLACAIGAAAATWSLLSAVLLRPLPVADPDRLVLVGERQQGGPHAGEMYDSFIYPFYPVVRDSGIFQDVAACWSVPPALLVDANGATSRMSVGFASRDFFSVLGIAIPLGRNFTAEDDRRGAAPVAILTERYWRRAFGADPAVVGRVIVVSRKPVTIVGILARGFRGISLAHAPELYLPLQTIGDVGSPLMNYFADENHRSAPTSGTAIVARLRPDSSPAEAVQRLLALPVVGRRSAPQLGLTPIQAAAIPVAARAGMRQFTALLAATVGMLLVAGCGTVGMLLLIRTEARREEFAMCLALGASRARLARGVALEGAVLSAAGALAALPVAWWLFAGVRLFRLPGGVDIGLLELTLDRGAVAAAAAGAVAGTLLITLIAGVFGFSANVLDALRSRGGSTPRATRRRTRTILVAAQVAVSLVLLTGAGLFARSLSAALALNAGRDMGRIINGYLSVGEFGDNPSRATAFFDDLVARLQHNQAVASVTVSVSRGGMMGKMTFDGVLRQVPSQVYFDVVDDRYFPTLRIPIVAGRNFNADDRGQSPRVAIVSESFARTFAGGRSPLGMRVTMPFSETDRPADVMEVVGVVPDVVTNVTVLEPLAMYFPMAQHAAGLSRTITVRASGSAAAARREILGAIKGIDPGVTPGPLVTLEESIARQMSAQQLGALVLGSLGVIAILLTALGTYVLAESMAILRMREMGIRAALGATAAQLGAIVLAETGRLVGVGLVTGLGISWIGARTIRAFLFQVQPLDPATLASVAALILTLALVVSLRPAWRAARVDLGSVLKEQ